MKRRNTMRIRAWIIVTLLLSACQPLVASGLPIPAILKSIQFPTGGQLAYIGGDGNVYVTTADRRTQVALTHDATTAAEGNGRSYHRIAWSPDHWLAFAAVERTLDKIHSELYVVAPGKPAQLVGQSDDNFVIYLYWSPSPCPYQPTCHQLAYLIGKDKAVALHVVQMDGRQVTNTEVGVGQPFYFSWAAQGNHLVWHTGGARRFNPQARITLYDLAHQATTEMRGVPGLFVAPAWSPTRNEWLDVVEMDKGMVLQRVAVSGTTDAARYTTTATPITQTQHELTFAWSPDGRQIAYAARFYGDDPFFASIYLYDVATGVSHQLTDKGLHVQAFFWSPDSTRIGYLHWLALPNDNWAQWRVYDVTTKRDRGYDAFNPSFSMRMVIGSFNQYAQSDRFWSPDGRYLTFADRDRNLVEHVWLVDTRATQDVPPLLMGEGALGVWSWQ